MRNVLKTIADTIAISDPLVGQIDLFLNQMNKRNKYPIRTNNQAFALIDLKTNSAIDMGRGRREISSQLIIHLGKTIIPDTEYGIGTGGIGADLILELKTIEDGMLAINSNYISSIISKGFQFGNRYGSFAVFELKFDLTFWTGIDL